MVTVVTKPTTPVGYAYATGATGANTNQFGQWTTFDTPPDTDSYVNGVTDSCDSPTGMLVASGATVHRLPLEQHGRVRNYMSFLWKSKKFVYGGRTSFTVMKVIYKGCVKLRVYVDGCCAYQTMLTSCLAFRLPPEVTGITFEIEFEGKGDAQVIDFEMASSLEELSQSG